MMYHFHPNPLEVLSKLFSRAGYDGGRMVFKVNKKIAELVLWRIYSDTSSSERKKTGSEAGSSASCMKKISRYSGQITITRSVCY